MLSKSVKDSFLSFSVMLTGVGLLFVGSVSFVPTNKTASDLSLPKSKPRNTLLVGGDVQPEILPVSHPLVPLASKDFGQSHGYGIVCEKHRSGPTFGEYYQTDECFSFA